MKPGLRNTLLAAACLGVFALCFVGLSEFVRPPRQTIVYVTAPPSPSPTAKPATPAPQKPTKTPRKAKAEVLVEQALAAYDKGLAGAEAWADQTLPEEVTLPGISAPGEIVGIPTTINGLTVRRKGLSSKVAGTGDDGKVYVGEVKANEILPPTADETPEQAKARAVKLAKEKIKTAIAARPGEAERTMAFSPNGNLLATGSSIGCVRLHVVTKNKPRIAAVYEGPGFEVTSLVFNRNCDVLPDGQFVAGVWSDGSVRVLDAGRKLRVVSSRVGNGIPSRVEFDPDGTTLQITIPGQGTKPWVFRQ